MAVDEEISVGPELSQEFKVFQEFCTENSGQELAYFEVVRNNPLEIDPVTLAFSMRHLLRLSQTLMNVLLESLDGDSTPTLDSLLKAKGIELGKSHATSLREVIFSFRDCNDAERQNNLVKAFQLMTMSRLPRRIVLNLAESYAPPEEGWTSEDFGGDESLLETVRSVEDPHWIKPEE